MDLYDIAVARNLTGGSGGGGGSSDFSTAEVTVTITKGGAYFDIPSMVTTPVNTLWNYQCNSSNGGGQFTIPLYKGSAYLPMDLPVDANVSVTGDVVVDGEALLITGDCTITIS